jgi:EAL domain-containing protein (putative c-di-GMP-specific phosphodiesterase class I)
VGVAIDDFGMGHSSLSRLKDLPVSHLKIDGSFVRDTEDNDSAKAMLASIIEMAHNLGMKAIAEWVETKAQVESLRSSGCDFAQGYFFSPPLPADRFRAFALERTAPVSRKRRAAVVKAG